MAETEIDLIEDDDKIKKQTVIDRHGPRYSSNDSQPTNPLEFSFYTTVKKITYLCLGFQPTNKVPNDVRGTTMTS
jgi:hypothetical protein